MKTKTDLEIEKFVFDNYLVLEKYSVSTHWYENVWQIIVESPKRFFVSLF